MALGVKSISVNLPFDLGSMELEINRVQQRAAWKLYVELVTRIAVQKLDDDEGLLRKTLNSLLSTGLNRNNL